MDPLIQSNEKRYVLFPIQHHDLFQYYKLAEMSFWHASEADFSKDLVDFDTKLTESERQYLSNILAFFASADGVVNENLAARFLNDVQYPEARSFYAIQIAIETIHSETYSLMIDSLIRDEAAKNRLFQSLQTVPAVAKKAYWAQKWITNGTFAERLIAFACVEGIFFSGSFAAIYWLRKRGLMPGLSFINDKIATDEGLHTAFACHLYKHHIHVGKLSSQRILEIVHDAVAIEKDFQTISFPCDLIGLNDASMCRYIEYVADFLLGLLGEPIYYHVANPFEFMTMIALKPKTNFFEARVAQYKVPLDTPTFSFNLASIR